MALADTKRAQTFINILGYSAQNIRTEIQTMKDVRTLYQAQDPPVDLTGTPIEGQSAAINNALNALDTLVNTTNDAQWSLLINSIVPSHRGEALE